MNGRLDQKEYVRLKSRLTRCLNRYNNANTAYLGKEHDTQLRDTLLKETKALKKEASESLKAFETKGFPDQWHNWQRAAEDAEFTIGRLERR